ncbi:hypothetical protein GH810_14385 [Acetobacterium paludosum]|uniref:Uncharacterized protein n=1 Tax=Acetobacterium paludosum TaxID=52693 RepID=A0A923I3X9_9FIRM|nr:hypothetical protein [Acetobacterium paludosum]MBC3889498.1 hypothetical protein [Acetobacterium paludosum]
MFKYTINDQYRDYFDAEILPSGQTIRIEFQEDWTKKIVYFNIFLVTKHKKKAPYPELEQTGKDGLKGLMWARSKILEFEKFIREDTGYDRSKIIMICRWDDNRRRNVYFYGLSKCGYKYGMIYGSKAILKQI